MKKRTFEQSVQGWSNLLAANPVLVPWSQFTQALPGQDASAEFVIGQLTLAALAVFRDATVSPTQRAELWQQLTSLVFNTTESASSLGLLADPVVVSSPGSN